MGKYYAIVELKNDKRGRLATSLSDLKRIQQEEKENIKKIKYFR